MLLPWSEIETVLLDMDGTLLDLHFDNYFWLEYLPHCYCEAYKVSYSQAKALIDQECKKVQGTLNWYCLDYWTKLLGLPIIELKQDIANRIQWRKNTELFLARINEMGKQVVLITNAHPSSLALKKSKVNLDPWFDTILSAHEYGYPKESQIFWARLQQQICFNPEKTLFIDDSLSVLKSAQEYKIKFIYSVLEPDTQQKSQKNNHEFGIIKDYADCF
ncbi:GMP/IMP nucleotidase [Entomomonas moraniae]|uniref:GMP/IMP nucleotidase n=1 Tax=Entomomonas moraniae TaxID=2213226 RepID=A0A3Q9JMN3_9GAMM|nr:GMP/IMP nucleotidase [Entomomonas moraniae]AZS51786.1 GMP/IMP nucleotidase [Entomomonas moraniae]